MQFSIISCQTAVSSFKTSYDVLKKTVNIKMSRKNAADRSEPFFTTAVTAASEKQLVDHGYRGLSCC